MELVLIIVFSILFIGIGFVVIPIAVAAGTGWSELQEAFPAGDKSQFTNVGSFFSSAVFETTSLMKLLMRSGSVRLAENQMGLWIETPLGFLWSKPLVLPWDKIVLSKGKYLFTTVVYINVELNKKYFFRLSKGLFLKLAEQSKNYWPEGLRFAKELEGPTI